MPKLSYIESLPKKLVGAACVLHNQKKDLLIMKPAHREGWLIPGGPLRFFESPAQGCIRKTQEEVGLVIEKPQLIGVAHSIRKSDESERYESLHFIFHGGTLTDEQVAQIKLEDKIFEEYRFVPQAEAIELLSFPLDERIRLSLEAMSKGTVASIELVEG